MDAREDVRVDTGMGERRQAEAAGEKNGAHSGVPLGFVCQGPRAGSRWSRDTRPGSSGGQNPLSTLSPRNTVPLGWLHRAEAFGANTHVFVHSLSTAYQWLTQGLRCRDQ